MSLKDERGLALPLVLTIMLVLGLLGGALLQYSTVDAKHAIVEEKKMQAHYVARSGAVATITDINTLVDEIEKISWSGQKTVQTGTIPLGSGFGNFNVKVTAKGPSNQDIKEVIIESTGYVNSHPNIKDTVKIVWTPPGTLPDPDDVAEIFPDDFDFEEGWTPGTTTAGGTQWVEPIGGNSGRIKSDTGSYEGVSFPSTITVEHQEGQQTFNLHANYMLFWNPNVSLYVSQGNILRLHSDVIVFMGEVALQENAPKKPGGELCLRVISGGGQMINGMLYGKVYFYKDVTYPKNAQQTGSPSFVPAGAYYYRDGLILRGKPEILPSLANGGLIPIGGDDSMKWQ